MGLVWDLIDNCIYFSYRQPRVNVGGVGADVADQGEGFVHGVAGRRVNGGGSV